MSGSPIELLNPPVRRRSGARTGRRRLDALRSALADLNAAIDALFGPHGSRPRIVDDLLHTRDADLRAPLHATPDRATPIAPASTRPGRRIGTRRLVVVR